MKSPESKLALLIFVLVGLMGYLSMDHIAIARANFEQSYTEQPPIIERLDVAPVESIHSEYRATAEEVCMAQVLYSESKNSNHWVYIGWSVRNRVELQFRGTTYCEVAHHRGQFSAISYSSDPGHKLITNIHSMYLDDELSMLHRTMWEEAIRVGRTIMNANSTLNPVPDAVFFWYVPAYTSGNINWPEWAKGTPAPYVLRKSNSKDVAWAFYRQSDVT